MTETDSRSEWRRPSPWSIFHFAARAIVQNLQAAFFFAPATYGLSRSDFAQFTWTIPVGIIILVLATSILRYFFFWYRVLEDSVQIRRGVLFKKQLNLSFERIQNISLEHPFYFRPFGLVSLKIDGAGSTKEEVYLAALDLQDAQETRKYIIERKRELGVQPGTFEEETGVSPRDAEEIFFERSPFDLVIHGLTNNRSFLAIAGIAALMWQTNISVADLVARLGIDFDVVIAGMSVVRLAVLLAVSFVLAVGVIAFLSVLVSIVTYFGFTIFRTSENLTVKRGLLTKHEISVKKSRIQTVMISQDWIDFLIDRRNVIFAQISHRSEGEPDWAQARKKIYVPSVRLHETVPLIQDVIPVSRIDDLPFTPISKRYFTKHAVIRSLFYMLALLVLSFSSATRMYVPIVLVLWPAHVALVYMKWKRAGLAIDGDIVVARGGVIGVEYHVFLASKAQDVSRVQSLLMRRRHLSSLVFNTASSTIRVRYLDTAFAKTVVDYCVYRAESAEKSWM